MKNLGMKRIWTRGAGTALSVVLAAAGIGAAVLALLLLPPWLVDQAGAGLEGAELTKAVTEERRTVLAVLAAIGAAVTLWYTHQRQSLDRDANRTDRYTKAVEQLGDDTKPSVQLGGVYALERVAFDSRRDRAVSIEVLSAFVRQGSRTRAEGTGAAASAEEAKSQNPTPERAGTYRPSEPVVAALSVLARRPRDSTYPPPNLATARLSGVGLSGAYLARADLTDVDLTDAYMVRADLTGAYLVRADLTGANLRDADLTGSDLTGADLRGADLTGADLTGVRYGSSTTWPYGFSRARAPDRA
jgi:Pentapeptide repeats (8 copies)